MASIDPVTLSMGDVVTNLKGAKTIPLSANGTPAVWTPEFCQVAFQPTAFGGEDVPRVNLVMKVSEEVICTLTALDHYLMGLLSVNSAKVFGKDMTIDEVKARFSPSIKTSEKGYSSTFKCKIMLEGKGAVKCWDMEKQKRDAPEDWTLCRVRPKITVKNLWLMSREVGILFECSDVQIDESPVACPF